MFASLGFLFTRRHIDQRVSLAHVLTRSSHDTPECGDRGATRLTHETWQACISLGATCCFTDARFEGRRNASPSVALLSVALTWLGRRALGGRETKEGPHLAHCETSPQPPPPPLGNSTVGINMKARQVQLLPKYTSWQAPRRLCQHRRLAKITAPPKGRIWRWCCWRLWWWWRGRPRVRAGKAVCGV